MAAPRLLSKTDLAGYEPVPLAGRAVLESHARLAALLAAHGLPSGLFAEPVLTRRADGSPAAVSWYGEGDGEPVPLSALSPARRAEAEAKLRAALAGLAPALDDPAGGALVRRALLTADPDSVLAVDGRVVITGWGLAPRGTGEDPVRLASLLREGLGRYLPGLADAGAEVFAATPPPIAPSMPAAPAAPAAVPPPPPRPAPPPSPPPAPGPAAAAPAGGWWMLPAGLGIAIAFLLLGFWLGWRAAVGEWAGRPLFASVVDEGQTRAALERARAANAALEQQIAQARAALAGEICRPEGPLPALLPTAPPPAPAGAGALPGASPGAASGGAAAEPPPPPDPPPLPR
jgi:hypothetical protein